MTKKTRLFRRSRGGEELQKALDSTVEQHEGEVKSLTQTNRMLRERLKRAQEQNDALEQFMTSIHDKMKDAAAFLDDDNDGSFLRRHYAEISAMVTAACESVDSSGDSAVDSDADPTDLACPLLRRSAPTNMPRPATAAFPRIPPIPVEDIPNGFELSESGSRIRRSKSFHAASRRESLRKTQMLSPKDTGKGSFPCRDAIPRKRSKSYTRPPLVLSPRSKAPSQEVLHLKMPVEAQMEKLREKEARAARRGSKTLVLSPRSKDVSPRDQRPHSSMLASLLDKGVGPDADSADKALRRSQSLHIPRLAQKQKQKEKEEKAAGRPRSPRRRRSVHGSASTKVKARAVLRSSESSEDDSSSSTPEIKLRVRKKRLKLDRTMPKPAVVKATMSTFFPSSPVTLNTRHEAATVAVEEGKSRLRSKSLPTLSSWEVGCVPVFRGALRDVTQASAGKIKASGHLERLMTTEKFEESLRRSRRVSVRIGKIQPDDVSSLQPFAGPSLLFSDDPDLRQLLVAGEIHSIIRHVTEGTAYMTVDFDTVLLTFREFTTPSKMRAVLSEPFLASKTEAELAKLAQLLRVWFEGYPHHFSAGDTAFLDSFRAFITKNVAPVSATVAETLMEQLTKAVNHPSYEFISPNVCGIRSKLSHVGVELLQVHPKDIARELTVNQCAVFNSIEPEGLLRDRKSNPSVRAAVDLFNVVSSWTATEILATPNAKKRASTICHFVRVAKHCHTLHNFATMMQIISGLGTMPVSRLKKTWKLVPKSKLQRLDKMQELMSPSNNYSLYRKALADTPLPAIPYVGIYMRNATFIEDGNLSLLANGMVNMEKIRMFGMLVREVRYFQLSSYNIDSTPRTRLLLETMQPITDDKVLYQLSYRCEPRSIT